MQKSVEISLKGTRYYEARNLLSGGMLKINLPVILVHEPDNPYDKNAVAVKLKNGGYMLGHVSRDLAEKYSVLCKYNRILYSHISSIEKYKNDVYINVRIAYEENDEVYDIRHNSRLWKSYLELPSTSGIYQIQNTISKRKYIGSSINIKSRVNSHIFDLFNNKHANLLLQKDFNLNGANFFEVEFLLDGICEANLKSEELKEIDKCLQVGQQMYNMTFDGQGKIPSKTESVAPISDRNINTTHTSDKIHNKEQDLEHKLHQQYLKTKSESSNSNTGCILFLAILIAVLLLVKIL